MRPRVFRVRVAKARPLAFLRAAHALTAHAWVVVDKGAGAWSVELAARPGAPRRDLAAAFRAAYDVETTRLELERAGRPLKAERLRGLLERGFDPADAAAAPALAPERLAEIEALLAEEPVADERAVRTPWEDLRK